MPSCTLPYKTLSQLSHWMKNFLSTLSRGFLFPHSWQAFILTFNVPVFLFLLVLLVLLVVVIFIPLSCSKAGHLCGLLYTSLISYINFSCCLRRFVRPLKPSIVLSCRLLALWTVLCQILCFQLIYPQASSFPRFPYGVLAISYQIDYRFPSGLINAHFSQPLLPAFSYH